jgi:peptide/nickel transport system substrate-binding protein
MLASLPFARLAAAEPRRALRVALSSVRSVLEVAHRDSQFAGGYRVIPNVLESPFRLDFEHGYVSEPTLAKAIARRDDRTVEVTLREGVRMHDGKLMTADDWAASFSTERLLGDNAPGLAVHLAHLTSLQGIEIVDEHKVRVIASRSDPVLEKRLTAWGTQIISGEALRKAPSYEDWARHPIGTGPYQAQDVTPNERMVLRAHDAYWGGKPPCARNKHGCGRPPTCLSAHARYLRLGRSTCHRPLQ